MAEIQEITIALDANLSQARLGLARFERETAKVAGKIERRLAGLDRGLGQGLIAASEKIARSEAKSARLLAANTVSRNGNEPLAAGMFSFPTPEEANLMDRLGVAATAAGTTFAELTRRKVPPKFSVPAAAGAGALVFFSPEIVEALKEPFKEIEDPIDRLTKELSRLRELPVGNGGEGRQSATETVESFLQSVVQTSEDIQARIAELADQTKAATSGALSENIFGQTTIRTQNDQRTAELEDALIEVQEIRTRAELLLRQLKETVSADRAAIGLPLTDPRINPSLPGGVLFGGEGADELRGGVGGDTLGGNLGGLGRTLVAVTEKSDALNASLMAFPAGEQSDAVARLTKGYGGLAEAAELFAQNTDMAAEAQRVLSGVSDTLGNAAATAFDRVVFGGEKVSDVLRDVERQLLNVLAQEFIFDPIREGISGGLKGTTVPGGGIAGLLSGVLSFFPSIFAHQGGVAGQLPVSGLVPADLFAGAPRFQGGGLVGFQPRLAPGEVPAILHRGEVVFTPGQLKALKGAGRAAPTVIMNVNARDANSFNASKGQILAELARALRRADRLNN